MGLTSKLTEEEIATIIELDNKDKPAHFIAKSIGRNRSTVSRFLIEHRGAILKKKEKKEEVQEEEEKEFFDWDDFKDMY